MSSTDEAVGRAAGRTRLQLLPRGVVLAAIDGSAWSVALVAAVLLRYDGTVPAGAWGGVFLALAFAVTFQVVAGLSQGLYLGRWRVGSFEEVAALVRGVVLTTCAVFVVNLAVSHRLVPASVPLGGGGAALVLSAGVRYAHRLRRERQLRPSGDAVTRMIVFGAGEGAVQAITAMLRHPNSAYLPVALLDDDMAKRRLRIRGVPVVGTRAAMAETARRYRADTLLIAVPSAPAMIIRDVATLAADAGLATRVLPAVSELVAGTVRVEDIRPPSEVDLLGRHHVETDVDQIAAYITGRRVLVTGAGGSIGSELCRQLVRFGPATLVMLDRDESALHGVQLSIDGRADLDSPNLVVADVRDRDRICRLFAEHRPQVVFHAAALKHVPLLEQHVCEAVKTNVTGTQWMLHAALATGVERFVTISTDKAADPINVLGFTKRIAERLTTAAGLEAGTPYVSVRFGNVLRSRGSVIETFSAQIARGGPVTVTAADVTRYFMTVGEAVQLTIQAGALGRTGEALVLDMGAPVRIIDVARRLVEAAGQPIEIELIGLRRGEKLHEVLLAHDETGELRDHALIRHVAVPPLAPDALSALAFMTDAASLRRELQRLVRLDTRSSAGPASPRACSA